MSRRHPNGEPRICFDLDGTLTVGPWPLMQPHESMIAFAREMQAAGVEIAVFTGRREDDRAEVQAFLDEVGIKPTLLMLGKPPADVYVDDMGLLVSERLLNVLWHHTAAGDEWAARLAAGTLGGAYQREVSATVENEDRVLDDEPAPKVVIPFSSGMDSLVLWLAAHDEGLPYELVYFDFGQSYAPLEITQARKLAATLDAAVEVVQLPVTFVEHEHILLGRNAIIVFEAAGRVGAWGEVHFGVLGGESPQRGGDKSHRFLADTQALLTLLGRDVRLCTPLAALDKPDLVAWLERRGYIELLMESKTCFDPNVRQCGACVPCFRKWSALLRNFIDPAPFFSNGVNFAAVVERYERRLQEDGSGYTATRRADLEYALAEWTRTRGR